MTFKVTGRVTFISDVEQFGAGKESRRIIVEQGDKYPNHFPISFYGDRMQAIANISVGDVVEVDTYPGGRLKKGDSTQAFTYLNGAACMKMETGQKSKSADTPQAPVPHFATTETKVSPQANNMWGSNDDVPF